MWIEAVGRIDRGEIFCAHLIFFNFLITVILLCFFCHFTRHICLDRGAGVVG